MRRIRTLLSARKALNSLTKELVMQDIITPVTLEVQNVVIQASSKFIPQPSTIEVKQITIDEYLDTLKENENGEES